MIAALLLAAATPQTAVEAERAFARLAQDKGQWTAFRAFATPDATMFWPQPVNAQEMLRPLEDPPRAIEWAPAESYVACDGSVAANTGPWRAGAQGNGYFSTIWERQAGGEWKWTVDGGDTLAVPRSWPRAPRVRQAACTGTPPGAMIEEPSAAGEKVAHGGARDRTLLWSWRVMPDGARRFRVDLWDGTRNETVIDDRIAAPPARTPKP